MNIRSACSLASCLIARVLGSSGTRQRLHFCALKRSGTRGHAAGRSGSRNTAFIPSFQLGVQRAVMYGPPGSVIAVGS